MRGSILLLLVLVSFVVACAPAGPTTGPGPVSRYVGVEGEPGETELLDDRRLFRRAGEFHDHGRYLRALRRFRILLAELPGSPLRPLVLYNAGLCLEALRRYDEAIASYERYLETAPSGRDARDARFHMASCHEARGRWGRAEALYLGLLAMPLEAMEELMAEARLGRALLEQGRDAEAEPRFRAALHLQRHHEQLKLLRGARPAALAAFGLAEVLRRRVASIALRLPVETMARDLDRKSRLFLKAQDRYLDAMRFQDRTWSVAAGCQLGVLYEEFRADLADAERPGDLATPEQQAAYEAALHDRLAPLVDKARVAYEMTLEMAARMGAQDSEWAKRTAAGLRKLRGMLGPKG